MFLFLSHLQCQNFTDQQKDAGWMITKWLLLQARNAGSEVWLPQPGEDRACVPTEVAFLVLREKDKYCFKIFLRVLGYAPPHTRALLLHLGEAIERTKTSGAGKAKEAVMGQKYSHLVFCRCSLSEKVLAEYFSTMLPCTCSATPARIQVNWM